MDQLECLLSKHLNQSSKLSTAKKKSSGVDLKLSIYSLYIFVGRIHSYDYIWHIITLAF
jgi:hypothetical protein